MDKELTREEIPDTKSQTCIHCGTSLPIEASYCAACGNLPVAVFNMDAQLRTDRGVLIRTISFYGILIGILIVSGLRNLLGEGKPNEFFILHIFFAFFVIIFGVLYGEKWFKESFRVSKIPNRIVFLVLLVILGSAPLVLFINREITEALEFTRGPTYYDTLMDTGHPFLYGAIFFAIFPAIFEEVAFRGFLMSDLLNTFKPRMAIFITSILFVFAHFHPKAPLSFIGIYWLLPFAFLLGYLRIRYRTIWLGIIIHFAHNFSVFLYQYLDVI